MVPGRQPTLLSRFENETPRIWEKRGLPWTHAEGINNELVKSLGYLSVIHKEHNTMMMRLLGLSLVVTAGLSIAASTVLAAPEHERLRGIVSAVSANEVKVRTARRRRRSAR